MEKEISQLRSAEVELTTGKIVGKSTIAHMNAQNIKMIYDICDAKEPCVIRLMRDDHVIYVEAIIESVMPIPDGVEIEFEILK